MDQSLNDGGPQSSNRWKEVDSPQASVSGLADHLRRPRIESGLKMGASVSTLSASGHTQHVRSPSARRRAETQDSDKAGRTWAREVDDPWWPCILTLDGGGIRGYSSLLILKALMHEVWIWEQRLDAEEAEQEQDEPNDLRDEPAASVRVESPQSLGATSGPSGRSMGTGNVQVGPGAAANNDLPVDVSTTSKVSGSVEADYGVTLREPPAENVKTAAAHSTLHHDRLTADVTTKKAMSEEELLPCHYFDFMYGTSTGGLIATLLGRLRMTVSESLELYRSVGEDLFGKQRSHLPLMTKYYHQPLERAVQDIVGSRCHEHPNCDGKDDLHPWDTDHFQEILEQTTPFDVDQQRVCQSCCLTATHDEQISEAYLLRTYPHYYSDNAPNWITRYNEGADELPIWKVARATTAAPFYFDMVRHEVEGQEKLFKDGGIRENNPSGCALSEFHAMYEGKAHQPALLLSVGTGRPDQTQDGFASAWPGPFGRLPFVSKFLEKRAVLQNLLIKYTEGEKQHHQMREHAHGEHTWYKRLNVSDGLQTMPLDDWRKGEWQGQSNIPGGASLTHMEEYTEAYLKRDFDPTVDSYAPPTTMLEQAAEKLVRQRRARADEGGSRWDAFVGKNLHKSSSQANGHAS